MAKELTSSREKFCEMIAKKNSQYKSYITAYPKSKKWKRDIVYSKASNLMKFGKIKARIEELKSKIDDKMATVFVKSKEKILQEFEELIIKAKKEDEILERKDSLREVRECLKEQAKLLGYYVEKKEIKNFTFIDFLKGIDTEEEKEHNNKEIKTKEEGNNIKKSVVPPRI